MPTPFSHLLVNGHLLEDDAVPVSIRDSLNAERPAYVLGSTVPDARINVPDSRAATHFYRYDTPMEQPPWRVMLAKYPSLAQPKSPAHRAFVAGYVAHLAVDEIWSLEMLGPHFAFTEWGGTQRHRFFVLHLLLIDMDERDLAQLPAWMPSAYAASEPAGWLPFMPDETICEWRNLMHRQIKPGGSSETLRIFGERVRRTPAQLRALASNPRWMQRELWANVPPSALAEVEAHMLAHARDTLIEYMRLTAN